MSGVAAAKLAASMTAGNGVPVDVSELGVTAEKHVWQRKGLSRMLSSVASKTLAIDRHVAAGTSGIGTVFFRHTTGRLLLT